MRPSAAKRGYDGRWNRTRAVKLARNPLCEDCDERGLTCGATEVDHIDGLGPLGPKGHDLDNLRSLCKPCHSRKTVREDGGLGRNAKG
ncbi:HNH endonuclease [Gemmata obscuriglobus]|nr:HNH endonuclease [Gemmata obscuriglobus]VTS01847.1 hnh endonuclease : HNH endonuclease OS=Janthinobacterium lividum GN=NC77_18010 PE=4 SV=1: HNH [Gemmata obscuriglobus UQM 2246]